nr:hypothetical protein BaRGS_023937 [Batillaria attramentaria]
MVYYHHYYYYYYYYYYYQLAELGKIQETFEANHSTPMASVAEKELAGDVRSLVLALLSRANEDAERKQ